MSLNLCFKVWQGDFIEVVTGTEITENGKGCFFSSQSWLVSELVTIDLAYPGTVMESTEAAGKEEEDMMLICTAPSSSPPPPYEDRLRAGTMSTNCLVSVSLYTNLFLYILDFPSFCVPSFINSVYYGLAGMSGWINISTYLESRYCNHPVN